MSTRPTPVGPKVIETDDMQRFLESGAAGFRFEMQVLNALVALGFRCEHGGIYVDPITERHREYDIRARNLLVTFPPAKWNHELLLSVECKNISPTAPLLLHCTPRTGEESVHEVIQKETRIPHPTVVAIRGNESVYRPGDAVGKRTDQVQQVGESFSRSDTEVFEKITQAVNAANDLVHEAATQPVLNARQTIRAVVPIVVVPAGMLWRVRYADNGEQYGPPERVDRVSKTLRVSWTVEALAWAIEYSLSHLEIVTLEGLPPLIDSLAGDLGLFDRHERAE
jgi:hypothetical protein